jgi:hypothetical protein
MRHRTAAWQPTRLRHHALKKGALPFHADSTPLIFSAAPPRFTQSADIPGVTPICQRHTDQLSNAFMLPVRLNVLDVAGLVSSTLAANV